MACRRRGLSQLPSDLMGGAELVTRTLACEIVAPLLMRQVSSGIAVGETSNLVNLCCPRFTDA